MKEKLISPKNNLDYSSSNRKNAVIELEDKLKDLKNISYKSIDNLMRKIMKRRNITAKELHNDFVSKHNKTPDTWIKEKTMKEEKKSLRNTNPCWKGYTDIGTKKKNGKTVPNCVPIKEQGEMMRYCPKCKKDEKRSECKYGVKYWDMYSLPSRLSNVATSNPHYHANSPHPGNFSEQVSSTDSMSDKKPFDIAVKKIMSRKDKLTPTQRINALKQAGKLQGVDEEISFTVGNNKLSSAQEKLHKMNPAQRSQLPSQMVKKLVGVDLPPLKSSPSSMVKTADSYVPKGKTFSEFMESIDKSKMKCNSPKSDPVGDSLTGKSHVVKACENGKEKIIRFGQRGVKGSPEKQGESESYKKRRESFKARHSKNIAKGKMSAAYWSNLVKW